MVKRCSRARGGLPRASVAGPLQLLVLYRQTGDLIKNFRHFINSAIEDDMNSLSMRHMGAMETDPHEMLASDATQPWYNISYQDRET